MQKSLHIILHSDNHYCFYVHSDRKFLKMKTYYLLTVTWSNSGLIYTSADPGWCCKNPVNLSLPFQIYVTEKIFRVFTGDVIYPILFFRRADCY